MLKTKIIQFCFSAFTTTIVKLFFVFVKDVNALFVETLSDEQIAQIKFLKFEKLIFYKEFFENEHIN